MPSGASSRSSHNDTKINVPILTFEEVTNASQSPASSSSSSSFKAATKPSEPNRKDQRNVHENDQATIRTSEEADADEPLPVSKQRLYLMVCADFGLSFTWLCKFAVATPYFQHSLKAGAFLSHVVWIMGPLSGLLVAPFIGVLSDRCTMKYGRRRPFIFVGTVLSIIGMLIFSNVIRITGGDLFSARILAVLSFGLLDFATNIIMFPSRALLGDLLPKSQQHPAQSAAAVVASLGEICAGAYIYSWKDAVTHVGRIFAVASILMVAACTVSLVVCVETPLSNSNQNQSSSSSSSTSSITVAGSGVLVVPSISNDADDKRNSDRTNVNIQNRSPSNVSDDDEEVEILHHEQSIFDDDENRKKKNTQPTNLITIPSSSSASVSPPNPYKSNENANNDIEDPSQMAEQPQQLRSNDSSRSPLRVELLTIISTAIRNFPKELIPVGVVYGLAWFVWFASLPYYSHWIGVDVLHGDPHATDMLSEEAQAYQLGVRVFSVANMVKAFIALIFAAYYPSIIELIGNIGERIVFSSSFFVFSIILFKFSSTNNMFTAAVIIASGSVPFIVTQTIPIAIVVQKFPRNLASNLGVMNLFCVIPQLIDTLYTGKIAELTNETVVLKVAACWGFAASITALLVL